MAVGTGGLSIVLGGARDGVYAARWAISLLPQLAVWIVLTLVYEVAVSDWIFAGFGVSLAVAIWVVASYLRERRVSFAESVSNDGAKR
jgi:hypothetical protein